MMPDQLAAAAAAALCSFLAKAGAGAAGELGKEMVSEAKALWARLHSRWSGDDGSRAVANKIEVAPEAPGSKNMLTGLLLETMESDRGVAEELRAFLQLAAGSRPNVTASGERAVAIGGSNLGSVNTGDTVDGGREGRNG